MDWPSVQSFAIKFQPYLLSSFPHFVEEMKGVAEGAGVGYDDILALNVRTEIAFGSFVSDGCTALSWLDEKEGKSFLGQNWDWDTRQAENLMQLKIHLPNGLRIQTITEAGIIGKIGLNSSGVGCTLNAIKAHGVSFTKIPCHLALRTVLSSSSREAAVEILEKEGVASACHILVADVNGGVGLECSSEDVVSIEMDGKGRVLHTNHFLKEHKEGVVENKEWLRDTGFRLKREEELVEMVEKEGVSIERIEGIFEDEVEGGGAGICRKKGENGIATLFNIVMDLGERKGRVKVGRPVQPTEILTLNL